MRIKHTLWRVNNGWLLVPASNTTVLTDTDAPQCEVFKTLKEFSDAYPKRERRKKNSKPKLTTKETTDANITKH